MNPRWVEYHLVICYITIWKITIEIVTFPMNSMVIFHSYLYVYQRVTKPTMQPWNIWFSGAKSWDIDWRRGIRPGSQGPFFHVQGIATQIYSNWCWRLRQTFQKCLGWMIECQNSDDELWMIWMAWVIFFLMAARNILATLRLSKHQQTEQPYNMFG